MAWIAFIAVGLLGATLAAPAGAAQSVDVVVTQATGTAPFDAAAGAGNDTSATDAVVRSNDQVTYDVQFNVNDTQAGSSTGRNVTIRQTLPAGLTWTRLPATCLPGRTPVSEISADGLTIVCNVGDIPTGTARTLSLVAKVKETTNGTVLNAAPGSTTAEADGAAPGTATPDPVTVSSIPRVDMVKSSPNVTPVAAGGAGNVPGYLLRYPVSVRITDFGGRGLIGYEPPAAAMSLTDDFGAVSPNAEFVSCSGDSGGSWSCAATGQNVAMEVALANPASTTSGTLSSTNVTIFVPETDVTGAPGGQLTTTNTLTGLDASGPDGTPAVGEILSNNTQNLTLSTNASGSFYKHYVDVTAPGRYIPGGPNVDRNGFATVGPGQVFQGEQRISSLNPLAGFDSVAACDVFDTTTQQVTLAGAGSSPSYGKGSPAWLTANSTGLALGSGIALEYSTTPTSTDPDDATRWAALRATDCAGGDWSATPPADPSTITKVRVRLLQPPAATFTLAFVVNLQAKPGASATRIANFMPYQTNADPDTGPWTAPTYDPATRGGARGDRLLLSAAQVKLTKSIIDPPGGGTPAIRGGDSVEYALDPRVVTPSGAAGATARNVQVTDVLPAGTVLSSEAGQEPSPRPSSVTPNADGTTTIVWDLGDLTSADTPRITFRARVSTTATGTKVNRAIVASPDDVGSPEGIDSPSASDPHLGTATIRVDALSGIQIDKSIDKRVIEPGDSVTFSVTYANLSTLPHPNFQTIDVLPFNGDGTAAGAVPGRSPGSAFHGGYALEDVSVGDDETVEYTDAEPAAVYATYDPSAGGQANYGALPPGKSWCTAAQIAAAAAGCPDVIADATALRVTRPGTLGAGLSRAFSYTLRTDGNRSGDVYANTAALRSSDIRLGTLSPTRDAHVVANRIGDYVWNDLNKDGAQDTDEPGVPGVRVTLDGTDKHGDTIHVTTTTGPDGRYLFTSSSQAGQDAGTLDLVSGGYHVTFDPASLPPRASFTLRRAAGVDAASDSDADRTSGVTQDITLPDPTPTDADGENLTLDAGIIVAPPPVTPPSVTPPPVTPPVANPPPVAPPVVPLPPKTGNKAAKLSLAKRANRTTVKQGGRFRYRITVRNRGTKTAQGVSVCDRLPGRLSLLSRDHGKLKHGRLCWTLKLKPHSKRTLSFAVRVDRDARPTSRMRNTAVVTYRRQHLRRTAHADVRVLAARDMTTLPQFTG